MVSSLYVQQHSGRAMLISGMQKKLAKFNVQLSRQCLHAAGKDVHITLSQEVGELGLLEREDAAIMNAALRPLASKVISAGTKAGWHTGSAAAHIQ